MNLGDVLAAVRGVFRALGHVVERIEEIGASLVPVIEDLVSGRPPEATPEGAAAGDAAAPGAPATSPESAARPAPPPVAAAAPIPPPSATARPGAGAPAPGVPDAAPGAVAARQPAPATGEAAPHGPAPGAVVLTAPPAPEAPLPAAYGHDHVGLLPRDPWWLFAYWEVKPRTRVEALRALGAEAEGACAVLRVLQDAGTPREYAAFDIELTPGADRWYVQVPTPDAAYAVEVGLRTAAGRFVRLGRSDVVTTPPAEPASEAPVEWAEPPPVAMLDVLPELPDEALDLVEPEPHEPAPHPAESPLPATAEEWLGPWVPSVETEILLAPSSPRSSESLPAR